MSKEKVKIAKKIKIEYVLVVFLAILALVIFFSSTKLDFGFSNNNSTTSNEVTLEEKLEKILSNVKGVGKTVVSINLDGTSEEVILKNTETKNENGSIVTVESAVLVNGKPYVLKELSPKILGVVVVCEGADNINSKIAITEVLTTILGVSSDNIRILKMK